MPLLSELAATFSQPGNGILAEPLALLYMSRGILIVQINLVHSGGADRSGGGGVKKGRGVSPNAAASVAATATAVSASSSSGTDRI